MNYTNIQYITSWIKSLKFFYLSFDFSTACLGLQAGRFRILCEIACVEMKIRLPALRQSWVPVLGQISQIKRLFCLHFSICFNADRSFHFPFIQLLWIKHLIRIKLWNSLLLSNKTVFARHWGTLELKIHISRP